MRRLLVAVLTFLAAAVPAVGLAVYDHSRPPVKVYSCDRDPPADGRPTPPVERPPDPLPAEDWMMAGTIGLALGCSVPMAVWVGSWMFPGRPRVR